MAITDDILIDYTNKRLYGEASSFLPGATFYTANEMYTMIMDTFDAAGAMDDVVPYESTTNILNYTIGNGWYIQQELIKHLKGASIVTNGYNGTIRVISLAAGGYVEAVAGDIGKTVTGGTTGDTGVLLDYDNTARKWWIRMVDTNDLFDNASEALTIGSGTGAGSMSAVSATGEETFSNIYSVGTIAHGSLYVEQNGAVLAGWWGTGNNTNHIDILVKVKEAGTLIDSGNLTVYARTCQDTFDHSSVTVATGGRTPVPLATQTDISATLTSAQVAAYVAATHGGTGVTAEIAVTFGTYTADVDESGAAEDYVVKVDCKNQTMSVVYQALQFMCDKDRSSQTLNSADARLYKAGDAGYTPVKSAPFATMAGSTLIFAQGVYPINVGTGSYIATDTSGTQHTPPNTINISVTGLVATDRVAVFETAAGVVKKTQFTSHASSNSNGDADFVVQQTIPKDTPSAGYIRVVDVSSGTEQRYQYASWSGSTFTLAEAVTLDRDYTGSDTAYVGYIDEEASTTSISKTVQYVSDRTVLVRVRNSSTGGNQIIPFEVAASIVNTGLAVPASRNPDYVISN